VPLSWPWPDPRARSILRGARYRALPDDLRGPQALPVVTLELVFRERGVFSGGVVPGTYALEGPDLVLISTETDLTGSLAEASFASIDCTTEVSLGDGCATAIDSIAFDDHITTGP
jgi:hypothetical protein